MPEVKGTQKPTAAVVEIVERGRATTDTPGGSLIVPSDVRINGMSVLTQGGVRVHEMAIGNDMAQVTITLPVRLLIIAAEGDLPDGLR